MNPAAAMLTDTERLLVEQCALQLRVIQADAVNLPAVKREEYLSDAIAQTFKDLAPADRKRLLRGLLERFPVAGRVMQPGVQKAPEPVQVQDTPEILFEKFVQAVDAIPLSRRAEMAGQLAEKGLAGAPGDLSSVALHLPPELLQKLGLSKDQSLDLERLTQLAVTLTLKFSELDRIAQTTLREVRRQNVNHGYDLAALAGQYVTGGVNNLEQGLQPTVALLAALMTGILGGGKEFGRQFSQRFSPEMIEQIVESEGKKGFMGPSADERCWQKYKKLYRDVESPDAVNQWFKDCLAKILDLVGRAGG